MAVSLPPLSEQVVVLTGASSGIGLATARRLARRGARLVLVARGEEALNDLVAEIGPDRALAVPADVASRDALREVADRAEARFGRIDTWVNDAGVAIYGSVEEVPWEDQRRLFETNYWGVVAGSLEALSRFKRRPGPGKLVNLGSVLSDRAMIYQGAYSASKHAVKALTDALRMELRAEARPVSVTLIKPGPIDTPYMEHARSYMDARGTRNPPPSYHPDLVARAIEHACERDARDLVVGGGGWATAKLGQVAPGLTDALMEAVGRLTQTSDAAPRPGMRDNLHGPARGGEERSDMPGPPPRRTSLLLTAQMHPVATAAVAVGVVTAAAALGGRRR